MGCRTAGILTWLLVLCGWCLPAARGAITLNVDAGWNGIYRADRWTPVLIEASDDQAVPARNVLLEILSPHDSVTSMRIVQRFAIGPKPMRYMVYVPLSYQLYDTVAVLRDGSTLRKLAEASFDAMPFTPSGAMRRNAASANDLVIGVSGRKQAMGVLAGTVRWDAAGQPDESSAAQPDPSGSGQPAGNIHIGYLTERMLPDAPIGYDTLDVLVLSVPDLVNMGIEQQQAIAKWVRAGGRLIVWFGQDLIPDESPITAMLPCTVEDPITVDLSLEDTQKLGVESRVERLIGRNLTPAPGAREIPWLSGKVKAIVGDAGLGLVCVLPIDASQLSFTGRDNAIKLWMPLLREVIGRGQRDPSFQSSYYETLLDRRKSVAMGAVAERLGDVPGVGKFDFSYIMIVMLAMMVIVGPVDWLVLRKLGRQPWTWLTTASWIVLVTVGALYMGYVFRSGDLHYRTVRLIDQSGDQVVSAMDVVGIYSPRTQTYELDGPKDGWWQPATLDTYRRPVQRVATRISTEQDSRGNRPLPMTINVWSLRFLEARAGDPSSEKPVLRCDLQLSKRSNQMPRVAGTITNLGEVALKNVHVAIGRGTAKLPESIPPGATVKVDQPVDAGISMSLDRQAVQAHSPYSEKSAYTGEADVAFMKATCDLSAEQTEQIDSMLKTREDLACVYAQAADPGPTVKLLHTNSSPAIEKHYRFVRALVNVRKVEP